jgi:hypothetical protein
MPMGCYICESYVCGSCTHTYRELVYVFVINIRTAKMGMNSLLAMSIHGLSVRIDALWKALMTRVFQTIKTFD